MKRGFALYLAFLLFMTCFLGWYLTRPKVLTVGLFAGSNWNVPEGDSYALLEEAIKRFEAEHPGVTVKYVSGIRKDDYSEWLAERLLKGEEPDIFVVPGEDFNLYASIGALQPLDRSMNGDAAFDPSVYYPRALDYGRYQGISYALPVGAVTTLMFVNKTLLAKEGIPIPANNWTWQDFLQICKAVTKDTDGDGRLDQFGVYDYTWRKAALTNDVPIFAEDGRSADFSGPHMEEVMRFMAELHAVSKGQEVTAKDFDMGRVAFRPFSFAEYRTYKPYPWRIKKYSSFEWDCIKLPAGPSGGNGSIMQIMLVGISARSSEQRLAWELLKTICYDPVIQEMVLTKSQGLPVRRDVVESARAQELFTNSTPGSDGMNLKTVSEVMADSLTEPKFPRYKEAMNLADNRLFHAVQENSSLSNALSQVQKEINIYLQR